MKERGIIINFIAGGPIINFYINHIIHKTHINVTISITLDIGRTKVAWQYIVYQLMLFKNSFVWNIFFLRFYKYDYFEITP